MAYWKWQAEKESIISIFLFASCLWLVAFLCFLKSIKSKYRKTFFDTRSGHKYYEDGFKEACATDYQRADIATVYRGYWKSYEGDVRNFFHEKWETWISDEPDWFTAGFRSQVPEDLVPEKFVGDLPSFRNEAFFWGKPQKFYRILGLPQFRPFLLEI